MKFTGKIPEAFDLPSLLGTGAGTRSDGQVNTGAGRVGARRALAAARQGTGSSHAEWQHSFERERVVRPQANDGRGLCPHANHSAQDMVLRQATAYRYFLAVAYRYWLAVAYM